jgi:hypothetical protein
MFYENMLSDILDASSCGATGDAIAAAASRLGAFARPNGSKDAALQLTLDPGSYTAMVHGKGGQTGLALIEVYDAQ